MAQGNTYRVVLFDHSKRLDRVGSEHNPWTYYNSTAGDRQSLQDEIKANFDMNRYSIMDVHEL